MHAEATQPGGLVRIADYLVERLRQHDVGHVFGVPGDYVLTLFDHLEGSALTVVNTCDEQGAGFAADAYARMRGLGVVCVTYGVGGLKVANTTAQAFAEQSPVIVISGAPSLAEQADGQLLHHVINNYDNQQRIFERLTVATAVLDDPDLACREIDRVIDATLVNQQPDYLEIPRDMTLVEVARPQQPLPVWHGPQSDGPALEAAVNDAVSLLRAAKQPVAFLGVEAVRLGLLPAALLLIEGSSIPTAVTPLDKSAISEQHPCFIGVYGGAMSRRPVLDYVESADCLLLLGALLTDLNLGGNTAHLRPERFIHATRHQVRIGYRTYDRVRLEDFVSALAEVKLPDFSLISKPSMPASTAGQPRPETPMTVARLFDRLGAFLSDTTVVIADPGDATFGALDLPVRQDHEFLANAFYASLGFAVPGSIGAQLAAPDRRPLVLVGDGAFQMTGMELSTSLRYGLNPVVVVLNNGGYLTEWLMADGAFNDVLPWNYARLMDVFGAGRSFVVRTEDDLEAALAEAGSSSDLCLIDVHLASDDASPALRRLAEGLGSKTGKAAATQAD
ncbi:MAG: alpha-keto acid decarboxylase family protein [Chloroflexia bacterium]|nr:alpha-keto acid decarboxylase family protein [Chloroflexia bacterium]